MWIQNHEVLFTFYYFCNFRMATTREMCFSLAEQYEELKAFVAVSEEAIDTMTEKTANHETFIKVKPSHGKNVWQRLFHLLTVSMWTEKVY